MAAGDIRLGGILLSPIGRSYTEGIREVAQIETTASGKTVKDIIAVKKTFSIVYEAIGGVDLSRLIDLYELCDELTLTAENTTGVVDSYTVLMGEFSWGRLILLDGGLWGGVEISLETVESVL